MWLGTVQAENPFDSASIGTIAVQTWTALYTDKVVTSRVCKCGADCSTHYAAALFQTVVA